ncbi:MAG: YybS family protein [Desulfobacterales bacterium]|nr:YybS family protein [Desulfobacterales bacterium]MDD4071222.1 YybS family protein [Desulfobacterales bacterium]MDD4392230.1 YybS family protein [Desulfobacterales bacterium]
MPHTDSGKTIKSIINGVAIILFFFAISATMPILGFFCSMMAPLPVLFYRAKLDRTTGVIIPILALMIMGAFAGGLTLDLLFYAELLLLGYVLSELMGMNLSIEKTVGYACGITGLAGLAGLMAFGHIYHTDILALVSDYVSKNLELTLAFYQNMGLPEESVHMISSSKEAIGYVLVRIIPALIVVSALIVSWANLLLARPLLTSQGINVPDFGPLSLWKAPEGLVWAVIGCGILILFPGKTVTLVALNGLIILMSIYFLEGIAIVSFYFEKKRFPRILRTLCYCVIAFEQVALLLVIGLGFFDIWLNFRKIQFTKNN